MRGSGMCLRGRVRRAAAIAVVSIAAMSPTPPAAAEKLSRGGAIQRALQHNPLLGAARAKEQVAEAHRGQARAARSPSLTLATAVGPSLQAELVPGSAVQSTENIYGDVGFDDLSVVIGAELQVTQPIYTFGKIDERERAAEHEIRARRAESRLARADLALTVAQLYEGLLLARDAALFFEEMTGLLERALADTEEDIAAEQGATEQDALRLSAAVVAARIGLNQARAGEAQAEAGLAAYLALDSASPIELAEQALEPLPVEVPEREQAIALALAQRPELAALVEGSQAYQALARAEAAGAWPDVFALGLVSAAYTPGRDVADSRYVRDPLNGFYPALLVGVRWQLTFGLPARRADEQRAEALRLSETRRFATRGIPAEVVRALQDLVRAQGDIAQAKRGVGASKAWLVRASADYSVGLGASGEVTDAARSYAELRLVYFDAVRRHNVALAELARATGTFDARGSGFYPTRGK